MTTYKKLVAFICFSKGTTTILHADIKTTFKTTNTYNYLSNQRAQQTSSTVVVYTHYHVKITNIYIVGKQGEYL
jgi:hypothetical protein